MPTHSGQLSSSSSPYFTSSWRIDQHSFVDLKPMTAVHRNQTRVAQLLGVDLPMKPCVRTRRRTSGWQRHRVSSFAAWTLTRSCNLQIEMEVKIMALLYYMKSAIYLVKMLSDFPSCVKCNVLIQSVKAS